MRACFIVLGIEFQQFIQDRQSLCNVLFASFSLGLGMGGGQISDTISTFGAGTSAELIAWRPIRP